MLTYENVVNAPLGPLQTAITDWAAMVKKLDELAESARGGMKAASDKAGWSGVTAGVARSLVDKTAKEFEDAAHEAKGIHKALTEGHRAFKTSREQLRKIADVEAPQAGFRVGAQGKVEAAPFASEADRYAARHDPDYLESVRVNLPLWQAKVDAAIDACDDADQSLSRLLAANVTDDNNFTTAKYGSLDAEEAARAVELARKGRRLTHEELVELNELLADNAKVPEFSTDFYRALGPKGALEFFGTMSTDTFDYAKQDPQRLKDVQELQKNLGFNLATATSSATEPHLTDGFAQDLRRLGTERIPLARYDQNPPYGYQLLGGIMRYGNYDPKFLLPIAEHATQIHAKDPDFFNGARQINGYGKNMLNPSGINGAGYDPVVSFLEALGHSPEAARQFFDPGQEPQAYNTDGTEKSGPAELGKGPDKKPITSYLDFFGHEKYDFTIDMEGTNPDDLKKVQQYMPDALGHALEAATLGHAWDDSRPVLDRAEVGARVMDAVVAKYGGDAGLLKDQEADGQVDQGRARSTISTTVTVQGMLDESRAGQVAAEGADKYEEYEKAHEKKAAWVEFGAAGAVAAGVAFLPATVAAAGVAAIVVPLATDLASGAVEQAASQVVGEWSDGSVKKYEDDLKEKVHLTNKQMYEAGERSAEAPMNQFMERHGIDRNSDFGRELITEMGSGYRDGNFRAERQGHSPETGN
ncbi:hypothetical protein [Streptomyces sp. NPDC058401]|uniref:hypothetical protein n=1 Tax=Streptomyces sp. NPDC058401 TaxID=3346480 RepID=UPI00364F6575